jgi:hypothetical protein
MAFRTLVSLAGFLLALVSGISVGDALDHEPPFNAASSTVPPATFVGALTCNGGLPAAQFRIPTRADASTLALERGVSGTPDAIWIDLSLFNNNFAPGTFLGAGPFAPWAEAFGVPWYGLQRSTPHFYRLNAHIGGQWVELGRGSFETIDCVVIQALSCGLSGSVQSLYYETSVFSPATPSGTSDPRPVAMWFDLSLADNGFLPGTFLGFQAPQTGTYQIDRILGSRRHYARTNYLYDDGRWRSMFPRVTFVSLDCANLPTLPLPRI